MYYSTEHLVRDVHVVADMIMNTYLHQVREPSKFPEHVKENTIQSMNKLFRKMIAKLSTLSKVSIEKIRSENQGDIYKIYDGLIGVLASPSQKCFWRSMVDSFLNKLHITSPRTYFVSLPTNIFNEFVKGITYFRNEQPVDRPIYHRDASCGSGAKTYLEKFELLSVDSDKVKKQKKDSSFTCYVERLIYNDVYENTLHEQDKKHIQELHNMRDITMRNHPEISSITANVTHFYNFIYPIRVVVTIEYTDGVEMKEEYSKPYGNHTVSCKQTILRPRETQIRVFFKTQTFESSASW